jgi:tRNA modification GTPase
MSTLSQEHRGVRVCVRTPRARGAIAVIRVWGPGSVELVDSVFQPERAGSLSETAPGRPRFGRVGEESRAGEEVVASVLAGPGRVPEVELHCHAGPTAVAMLVERLVAQGAERRQPIAWIRHDARALIAAEAMVDLARASTLQSAEILLDQWHGALEREVAALRAQTDRASALHGRDRLLERERIGLRLISGWKVALVGRPNVGKSRLMNALAGYTRAIVDPTPGTTRDVLTVRTALDGWPVEIADTAGIRSTSDALETEGISRARVYGSGADLSVLILDRSEPLTPKDLDLIASHDQGLIVANKADLPAAWQSDDRVALTISAERGDGIEALIHTIAHRLVPDPPPPGSGVPFRPRHRRWIESLFEDRSTFP